MKFYLAATAVVALAKQASAFRIVQNDGPGPKYCILVVPYDDTYYDWVYPRTGTIVGFSSEVLIPDTLTSTIGPNGINDPLPLIKGHGQQYFGAWTSTDASPQAPTHFTIYAPGGTTPAANQALSKYGQTTIDFCPFYSTYAPDHYCKGDGKGTAAGYATIDACCKANHPTEYFACYEASAGVVS
jgi:hypothetical protein